MVRLQLIMPVVVGAVFLGINAGRMDANASQWVSIFVPVGVTVLPCLSCLAFFSNIFGIDHEGFGAFVLLPTPRHRYVLGKNLALFPITCGLALVFIAMSAFFIDYRPAVLGAAILQVLQLNLMFCLVGNVLSMYFPFRIRTAGRWGAGNMSTRTQLLMIVVSPMVLMMVAILTVPTVLGLTVDALLDRFYGFQGISVGFLVSAFTLLLTVLAYWGSLGPMGRLLLQREQTILAKLQKDRE